MKAKMTKPPKKAVKPVRAFFARTARKQSSERASRIAGQILALDIHRDEEAGWWGNREMGRVFWIKWKDIRTLAASVLSQDEVKGLGKRGGPS